MATRSLTLAVMAVLVACAAAELPTAAFKNEGGPTWLKGPTFSVAADGSVASMGFNHDGDYIVIAAGADNSTVLRGVYSSWECVEGKPGYYTALLTQTTTDEDGNVLKEETLCEYGVSDSKGNRYSQSADACPTETENEDRFFEPKGAPKRDAKSPCA
ncbi:hypothetical protein COHA_006782 [Chlorella ohadii]|uniref:Uncharacterized protein n=1 Tax=Chlorella ohadii TaxID=2649997 RepID=A0AAD5DKA1_9CHLO|nr:hypothetical protein COHA_006782 [Chlorella ohadii]